MSDPPPREAHGVTCPHCRKQFEASLIEGGAARYVGFKCPFCKLFVPLERIEDRAAAEARPHAN